MKLKKQFQVFYKRQRGRFDFGMGLIRALQANGLKNCKEKKCLKTNSSLSKSKNDKMLIVVRSKPMILFILAIVLLIVKSTNGARMVRLCIASVDPIKLSSQCVMCSRREFPITAIDCTGITKMNDLISNPLSVREAACLIYNCRRQVPDIKPEPYHGSVSHAARANYASAASGTRAYGMMPPTGMFGGYSPPPLSRYADYPGPLDNDDSIASPTGLISAGMIGGPSLLAARQQALPYALVPAPYSSPFSLGSRKYKAALVPLFR